MYINSAGLVLHIDTITGTVNEIKPLCLCISEIHVTNNIYDKEIQIKGCNMVQVTSENKRTGGCCIYVREDAKIIKTHPTTPSN
jgi:hypothetical protein